MPDIVSENKLGTDTSKPKVSVVIPLYNHERYIHETVQSVLGQSFEDFELIIINDGSTDGSENVVKGITDKRMRYLSQENCGAPETINRGVRLARGEFISILNSDDIYDAHRLEECVRILENNPFLSAVFSHLEFIDSEGKFIQYLHGAEENWADHSSETSFKGEHNFVLDLLAGNFLTTTSNLFCRKDTFEKVGYFSNLRYAHDYDFFLRLCHHQKVQIIETPLVKYRIHSLNTVKENEPAVSFEVGLVLANFFLNYDVHRYFDRRNGLYEVMMKFVGSVNTYNADRMLVALLLFGMKYPEIRKDLLTFSPETHDAAFMRACIVQLKKINEGWEQCHEVTERLIEKDKELQDALRHAHEGWEKWKETNDLLIEKNKEASEGWGKWKETNDLLIEKNKEASEGWKHAHEGWEKWKETNDLLIEKNKEASEGWEKWKETNELLDEKNRFISALLNSRSYRLGRFLTWPIRRLMGRG